MFRHVPAPSPTTLFEPGLSHQEVDVFGLEVEGDHLSPAEKGLHGTIITGVDPRAKGKHPHEVLTRKPQELLLVVIIELTDFALIHRTNIPLIK